MNWKNFFIGISFLLVAFLIFEGIRKGRASEKNDWVGDPITVKVQGWGAFVLCVIVGVVFIFKALPA